jgi:hypothetical protein
MAVQGGQLIGERYRLEQRLSPAPPGDAPQGELWRASDQLAAEAPMALRLLGPGVDLERARQLWGRLQGVLHPQVPRLGAAIPAAGGLWLVREWQAGRTYQQLLEARAERQLVFGAGEVLLLLRQLLPVLAVLHSQELVHGDLSPANLLRREVPAALRSARLGVQVSLHENGCRSVYEYFRADSPCVAATSMAGMDPAIDRWAWLSPYHALGVVQHVDHVRRDDLAHRCQPQPLRQALEQRGADVLLPLQQLPVQRRRRDVQPARRLADRAAAPDRVEVAKAAGVQSHAVRKDAGAWSRL